MQADPSFSCRPSASASIPRHLKLYQSRCRRDTWTSPNTFCISIHQHSSRAPVRVEDPFDEARFRGPRQRFCPVLGRSKYAHMLHSRPSSASPHPATPHRSEWCPCPWLFGGLRYHSQLKRNQSVYSVSAQIIKCGICHHWRTAISVCHFWWSCPRWLSCAIKKFCDRHLKVYPLQFVGWLFLCARVLWLTYFAIYRKYYPHLNSWSLPMKPTFC